MSFNLTTLFTKAVWEYIAINRWLTSLPKFHYLEFNDIVILCRVCRVQTSNANYEHEKKRDLSIPKAKSRSSEKVNHDRASSSNAHK